MSPLPIREKASAGLVPEEGPAFQIAPLVDVVFVLMLFFMACAGWQVSERELNAGLPKSRDGSPSPVIPVDISADGQVIANGTSFGMPADKLLLTFRDWLKTPQSFGGKDPVVIRPNSAT